MLVNRTFAPTIIMIHPIIGLIGGMSWHSTVVYYDIINSVAEDATNKSKNAEILLYSVNSAQTAKWLHQGDFDSLARYLRKINQLLVSAGADFTLMACNSAHIVSGPISKASEVPFVHIADPVTQKFISCGYKKAGILGTSFTQDHRIYDETFEKYDVSTVYPSDEDMAKLTDIIYSDLCFNRKHRAHIVHAMANNLIHRGADAIILGCTELSLIFDEQSCDFPVLDSAIIHAATAGKIFAKGVDWWTTNQAWRVSAAT